MFKFSCTEMLVLHLLFPFYLCLGLFRLVFIYACVINEPRLKIFFRLSLHILYAAAFLLEFSGLFYYSVIKFLRELCLSPADFPLTRQQDI